MRLIKMFGLAAIAVGAFMAFLGATSASAVTTLEEVVLCKALEDPCLNGHYDTGTIIHGKTIAAPVLLGIKEILCASSTVLGKTTELLAHGTIETVGWNTCHTFNSEGVLESCTVTSLNTPYLSLVVLTANHLGYEQIVESSGVGRPSSRVVCPGADCKYGADKVLFEVLHSGATGLVVLDILQTLSGEGICFFTSGVWHAKYETKCLFEGKEVGCWPAMHAKSVLIKNG